MYKDQFAIQFSKKVCIYRKNYVRVNSDQILKVKRSRNMKMTVKKFENIFGIKLPYLSKELKKK